MEICEIGEAGLLQLIFPYCLPGTVGDDAAVLAFAGKNLVVTTDVLVDRVHFSEQTTTAYDVGWRSAAANLSDLAAMGATPVGITVGLGLPPTTPVQWVEELYRGLADCLQRYDTGIVGGDIYRSTVQTVAITAFGRLDSSVVIRRNAAVPGAAIVVTGDHGKSKAGLELLLNPGLGKGLNPAEYQELIRAHQRPVPRLDVVPMITGLQPEFVAGMDSSDGLLDAITQICRASGVGARIDRAALAIYAGLDRLTTNPIDWVLGGGEDFELVLCLPIPAAQTLVKLIGGQAAIIGETTATPKILLVNDGAETSLSSHSQFQHFSNALVKLTKILLADES
jgi:thiamine-monophosphate kinase